ncbi:MAG: zf-HC2 domain-containing protein [Ktedonobacteraceae bacterium]|nr:zf-HC2 domain-containing protein [Ktedonobacteraceae bacterium]
MEIARVSMRCSVARGLLQLYIDRQLTLDQMRMLEAHVANCPSCERELYLLETVVQDFRAIEMVPEPSDLTLNIMQRVALSVQQEQEPDYALLRPSLPELLVILSLSTIAMLGVILGQPSVRVLLPIANGHDILSLAFLNFLHLFIDVNSEMLMGIFWIVGTILGVWITLALVGAEVRSQWLKAMMDRLPVW